MALIEKTLLGETNKIEEAISRLKAFEPPDGYFLAFSGGKDSQCIYHLAEMAGVKFDAHYSVTSVDPPELVRFMMKNYPDVIWDYHRYPDGRRKTMWNIIENHTIPPTRQARYCCSELKETGGKGRVVVTGVRWAESAKRKAIHGVAEIRTTAKKLHKQAEEGDSAIKKTKRGDSVVFMDDNSTARLMVEQCYAKKKTTVNPIIDWTEEDVWEFLNDVAKVPHCELYDEGFTRLGCIGCPLQGRKGMLRDFERWPRYKQKYIKAFDRMIANHPGEIKVASGEPAGGGYSNIHRLAPVERLTENPSTGATNQVLGGVAGLQTGGGRTEKRASDGGWRTTSSPPRMVEADSGMELRLLGRELLGLTNGQENRCLTCGSGALEKIGTNHHRTSSSRTANVANYKDGSEVLDIMVEVSVGHTPDMAALDAEEPERLGRAKSFNRDPKVADYKDGYEVLELMLGD